MLIGKNYCIHDADKEYEQRPYEKCLEFGASALSDAQLLAVILRTGTNGQDATQLAHEIFKMCGESGKDEGLIGLLGLTVPELTKIRGIGRVKAIQIQCICELAKRMARQTAGKKLDFSNPESIADYYMQDLRFLQKECLIIAMLDSKCRLIRDCTMSVGTVNASLVSPRDIFGEALKFNAVSIVMLHNHPSGDASPSSNDLAVTKRVFQAGEIMGIKLIDHIIIGDNKYTSLREKDYI